ncbi:hypothetical protein LVD15_19495 [Fulvivirga maritima]|uniref:hypothetical protein n=1 Tax=Fulvivirga maritima TaxID=2904247 RepID=UPI001F396D13|nr:hypothetical protein [Fulvivirga maritima]UII25470.1 hypothetical protein LVD15_19495 [Fulvivirga maritima]
MKNNILLIFLASLFFAACGSDSDSGDDDMYTGRELTYTLYQASDYPTHGTVVFKELSNGRVEAVVHLDGTEGEATHPAHLHFGNIETENAVVAANFNDVSAENGGSTTVVNTLTDNSEFTFDDIENFNGSVKIHLSATGEGEKVILAAGNIGTNKTTTILQNGRAKVAICTNE